MTAVDDRLLDAARQLGDAMHLEYACVRRALEVHLENRNFELCLKRSTSGSERIHT